MTTLILECHVTIEPVFGIRLDAAQIICQAHGFKVADLLMQRQENETPTRSRKDTFCTGHGATYSGLAARMVLLCQELKANGYKIYRYKIEDVILDSRQCDSLQLLEN